MTRSTTLQSRLQTQSVWQWVYVIDNIYMGQQDAASPFKKKGPRDGVKLKKITKKKAKALKAAKQKRAKRNKLKLAQQLSGDGFNLDDGRNKDFRDWELMYGQSKPFANCLEIADQIEFLYGSEDIDDAQIMKMLDADEIFQMLDKEDKLERIMAIRRKLELKKLKMIKLKQLKAQLNVMQGKGKAAPTLFRQRRIEEGSLRQERHLRHDLRRKGWRGDQGTRTELGGLWLRRTRPHEELRAQRTSCRWGLRRRKWQRRWWRIKWWFINSYISKYFEKFNFINIYF